MATVHRDKKENLPKDVSTAVAYRLEDGTIVWSDDDRINEGNDYECRRDLGIGEEDAELGFVHLGKFLTFEEMEEVWDREAGRLPDDGVVL